MTSTKALTYFKNDCKRRIVADAGPEGIGAVSLQLQGEEWSGGMHRRKRKWLLLCGLVSGSIYICVWS